MACGTNRLSALVNNSDILINSFIDSIVDRHGAEAKHRTLGLDISYFKLDADLFTIFFFFTTKSNIPDIFSFLFHLRYKSKTFH